METQQITIGVVGYGQLGEYLVKSILEDEKLTKLFRIGFIWNRTIEKVQADKRIKPEQVLQSLDNFESVKVDLVVEVSHPKIIAEYGERFLNHANLFVGSPTAFADPSVEKKLRAIASQGIHGLYVPSGAFWGASDIQKKMASLGTIHYLTVTMKKHPLSMKLEPPLSEKVQQYIDSSEENEVVIYEGDVRTLCPLAPNNVNTMACAALAAHNLGFDKVKVSKFPLCSSNYEKARFVAGKKLEAHIVEVEVEGQRKPRPEDTFKLTTVRYNPAKPGAVTGTATYASFLSSLLLAHGRGNGVHFC